jgi:rhodanese-related sulfurtransferase
MQVVECDQLVVLINNFKFFMKNNTKYIFILTWILIFIIILLWMFKFNVIWSYWYDENWFKITDLENNFSQIDSEEFKKEIEDDDAILLDVRTPEELSVYWKIRDKQLLIDINAWIFHDEVSKLDKTKKYLIYCWHWNRSQVAREYMKRMWFLYVKDLRWWIDVWPY